MADVILPQAAPIIVKDVRRNKSTRDFDAFLTIDGTEQYLGSRERSWDAEELCNQAAYDYLMTRPVVAVESEPLPFDLEADLAATPEPPDADRIRITATPAGYLLCVDGITRGTYPTHITAQVIGGAWLCEAVCDALVDAADMDAYAAEWDAWVATCQGDPAHLPQPQTPHDLEGIPVAQLDLGDGLSRSTIVYVYRDDATDEVACFGSADAYTLPSARGSLTIEMDRQHDPHRCVGLIHPNGTVSHTDTAAELLQLATLVRRNEVYAALQRWAAEDGTRA